MGNWATDVLPLILFQLGVWLLYGDQIREVMHHLLHMYDEEE